LNIVYRKDLPTADFAKGGHTGMHLHVSTNQRINESTHQPNFIFRTSNFVLLTFINLPAAFRLGAVRQANQPFTNSNSNSKAKIVYC
jgi:hypothetical protein